MRCLMGDKKITILAAHDLRGAIGRKGKLPWDIKGDLRRFKERTLGKVVVMGRKTFESIGGALPGRRNVVVSHTMSADCREVTVAESVEDALALFPEEPEIMIIGGGDIYRASLPYVSHMILSVVSVVVDSPDTFFPSLEGISLECEDVVVHDDEVKVVDFFMRVVHNRNTNESV
jgi:dihydrofolate reductase